MLTEPSILMLMVAAILAGGALVMAFIRGAVAVIVAFVAMIVAHISGVALFATSDLLFWGAAAVIAAAAEYFAVARPPRGLMLYAAGGALAGAITGLALGSRASIIVASAVAALLAALAWKRTPAGRNFRARISPLLLATVGLCPIVNFTIIMLILAQFITIR